MISGKHVVDVVDGVRCAVVEKQASPERADFLRRVLEHNGYEVRVQQNIKPAPKAKPGEEPAPPAPTDEPVTYKVGVSDLSFVVSVMVYSRALRTLDDKVLLPTYWTQEDRHHDSWYWQYRNLNAETPA